MKLKKNDVNVFLKRISKSYSLEPVDKKVTKDIISNSINRKECIYIIDFSKNDITYKCGFEEFLGYKNDKISVGFMSNIIHKEDLEMVNRIRIATATFCLKNPSMQSDYFLSLTYRIKKNDGTYVDVLNQTSMYDTDENGKLISIVNRLTDISFMNNSTKVNWHFEGNDLDKKTFRREIYKDYQDIFTGRELEIIVKIVNGFTNKEIGEKLNISEHTVATHRKHILKKSKCHSSSELILFCSKIGINNSANNLN